MLSTVFRPATPLSRRAPEPEALRLRITTDLLFSYEEFGFELLVYKFFYFVLICNTDNKAIFTYIAI